ncbi:MAG: hypothetical protein IJR21_04345 [Synergistaceae bacterium]|nr:hypothetical protein [Synergistaceae bacterium]
MKEELDEINGSRGRDPGRWVKAPADTFVCESKGVMLRDVVQLVLDGYEDLDATLRELGLDASPDDLDHCRQDMKDILDIFVPVVNAWQAGSQSCGCGGGCPGCAGGCCPE